MAHIHWHSSYHFRFQSTNFSHIHPNPLPQSLSTLSVSRLHLFLRIIPLQKVKSIKKMIVAEMLWERVVQSVALQLRIKYQVQSWPNAKVALKCFWVHFTAQVLNPRGITDN